MSTPIEDVKKTAYYEVKVLKVRDMLNNFKVELNKTMNIFSNIYVKTDTSFILYKRMSEQHEKVDIHELKYHEIIDKFKMGDKFIIINEIVYKINKEFHVTTLFLNKHNHVSEIYVKNQLCRLVQIVIDRLAISTKYITYGVKSLKFDDDEDIQYFGNVVKHITFGINVMGKKLRPVNSFYALEEKTISVNNILIGETRAAQV